MTREQDYFKTFCKVSRAFGTKLGEKEILDLILQSSIETMNGRAACLFLADEEKDVFVPVAQKGLSETYLHAKPMQAKKVVDEILKGGYFAIADATTDPRLENHEEKEAEGIASILVVPVMVSGKAIGVLSLYSGTRREFTEDEAAFQTALAEQGAMAIQRARLFERISQNLNFFYDLASTINSSLEVKKILHILTADVSETLGLKGVDIRLWNREKGSLDLVASYGLSQEFVSRGPISPKHTVPKMVLEGKTVVIKDVRSDERPQFREDLLKEGVVSLIVVPVMAHGEVIGTMGLHSDKIQNYPDDVIKLAQALAHQGGLAIHNASMYLMLQEDKKSLEQDIWSHRSWF